MSNPNGSRESEGHSESPHSTTPIDIGEMPPLRLLVPTSAPPNSPIVGSSTTWTPNARLCGPAGAPLIWNGVETQTLELAPRTIATSAPYLLAADADGRAVFVDVRGLLTELAKMLNATQTDDNAPKEDTKRRRSTRRAARAPRDDQEQPST